MGYGGYERPTTFSQPLLAHSPSAGTRSLCPLIVFDLSACRSSNSSVIHIHDLRLLLISTVVIGRDKVYDNKLSSATREKCARDARSYFREHIQSNTVSQCTIIHKYAKQTQVESIQILVKFSTFWWKLFQFCKLLMKKWFRKIYGERA